MRRVVELQIRDFAKVECFDAASHELAFRDMCIIKSDYGTDYGKVVSSVKSRPDSETQGLQIQRIIRKAGPNDLEQIERNRRLIKEALQICREKVISHQLPMRVLAGEYSFDRHKLTFYFTAAGRLDFRALVHDLAAVFKARIDLHQIGPRDEAKIIGGIAPCGKTQVCCTQFMKRFDTITTRMAKVQRLPVHQEKLLGLCGQLKCCLKFELETYEELSKNMPREGSGVSTRLGRGWVLSQDILRQFVTVRLEDHREIRFPLDEITVLKERLAPTPKF